MNDWNDGGDHLDSDDGYDPVDDWFDEPTADGAEVGDPQWVDYREPMSPRRKWLMVLGSIIVVLALAAGALFVWVQGQIDPSGEPGAEVEIEIATGSTTEDIGKQLASEGVISSSTIWNYWTRINNKGPFQAGLFDFRLNSSFDEAVAVLEAGPRPPEVASVTIPEGLTIPEIVARLADPERGIERWDETAIAEAIASGEIRSRYQPAEQASMEGMLFPDTYQVADETDERTFIRRLVTELDDTLFALDAETIAPQLGLTPYEIVVVASLIEEEARVPDERPMIARVIYNRLRDGIPLGIDATSRYEAEISGRSRDDLDFDSDSPYNTRRIAGLPPTPIAAAGRASIEAALNPADGDWIYYVLADEQGNHVFTSSFSEFNRAKAECKRKGLGCG